MLQASETVVVNFGGTLQQVVTFDEEAATITTNIWFGFRTYNNVSNYVKLLIAKFFG